MKVGNKASYLNHLMGLGVNVPYFQIIDIQLKPENLESVKLTIKKFLPKFNHKLIAIRSSSNHEDNRQQASPGKYLTKLYQSPNLENILDGIKECQQNSAMSVIIQEMIDPESSGVLFTQSINLSHLNTCQVESVWGQGFGIVQGLITPDCFQINRVDKSIIQQKMSTKKKEYRKDGLSKVDPRLINKTSISPQNLKKLVDLGLQIELSLGCPQDIEWCIKDNQIYILQTRPITNLPNNAWFEPKVLNQMNILDNSNIKENFCQATSPLTYSFFRQMYYQSYKILLSAIGVPKKSIHGVDIELKNLIVYLNGHIQYNLTNWHKILALFPFIKDKHSFLEQMMGVKYKMNQCYLQEFSYLKTNISFNSIFKLFNFILSAPKKVEQFEKKFIKMRQSWEAINLSYFSLRNLIVQIEQQINSSKKIWSVPMLNDCYVMVACGLFKKEAEKQKVDPNLYLATVELSDINGVQQLEKIAEQVQGVPWWQQNQLLIASILKALVHRKTLPEEGLPLFELHSNLFYQIVNYIKQYGPRCANEQMLELETPHEKPELILSIINNFIPVKKKKKDLPKLTRKLTYLLHHAKTSIRLREKLRLYRAQLTMLNRRVFNAIGEYLWKLSLIDTPKDVFQLYLSELTDYSRGSIGSIIEIIQLRKNLIIKDPPNRSIVRGPISLAINKNLLEEPELNVNNTNLTKCTPVSPGIVEGKVILKDVTQLTDEKLILVTSHLDPSWIPLFGRLKGAIVEYGGTLTHTAIAARECGLPMVVNPDRKFLESLVDGQKIKMNANTGVVEIIK